MIAAFDLGRKNFAFAVKDKHPGEYVILKNINLDQENTTKTELCKQKKCELHELLINLEISTPSKIQKKDMIDLILKNKRTEKKDLGLSLFETMDTYKDIFEKCDIFLVERQMTTNLQALKLSHYLEAYLKIHYKTKQVINYNASKKTKKLGAVGLKTKYERKQWTIDFVNNILTGDNLREYKNLKKKDDVADVVCMIESYLV